MEQQKQLVGLKAIRAKCLDCSCQQIVEVRNCTVKSCHLHHLRMGRRLREGELGYINPEATSTLTT